jgi:23S rRNA pseudouridine2605 synthase
MAQPIRLNKLLSQRGIASRRAAEELIASGVVTVSGEVVTHPGTVVDPDSEPVMIGGRPLPVMPDPVYALMYKPRGMITSRDDPEGRKTVHELLPASLPKVEPVGKLDFDTEGALLFTNDGDLAHLLLRAATAVPRRYRVKVYRRPTDKTLDLIRKGKVFLDDGRIGPARVRVVDDTDAGNAWLEITITEGRNRLVRRLFEQLGHPVAKLRRESFATLSIRGMERGQVRQLTGEEVRRLGDLASGVPAERAGKFRYKKGFARPKAKKRPPKPQRGKKRR